MGQIRKHKARDVWRLLGNLASEWIASEYHPFNHNCVHFCERLCEHLGVDAPPAWVGRLAAAANQLLTPVLSALDLEVLPLMQCDDESGDVEVEDSLQELDDKRRVTLSLPTS